MTTGQQGQEPQSQFNQRSDDAALALKGILSNEQGINIPERKVEVGPDGQPPKPPPPEGSYARQAYDQARAGQQMQAQQMQAAQDLQGQQAPVADPQQVDGAQAHPLSPPAPPPQGPETDDLSSNAQQRFAKLTQDLREKDRQLQEVLAASQTNQSSLAETQAALQALQQQHNEMVNANLENLDPETRALVMQDARTQEHLAAFKQQIMSEIAPAISDLRKDRTQNDYMKLAGKYPGVFDIDVHAPLIQAFRERNRHASVEQAFKAVVEVQDLMPRGAGAATAAPPIVAPRASMQSPTSRYVPAPESNPEQEMQEEAAQIGKLMRSGDPADHKAGQRLVEKNLLDRLGSTLPGSRR
jgi:hypothetical protein